MPLHDTANILAKGSGPDATAVARRKASLLKKQRQLRRELRTLQDQSAQDLALLEKERQELKDGRLNAAASHAARKGLAQKPRSSRDRAEFDARTLKVEAPRAEQAAKRAEARCSLALKRLAVAKEKVESLPGNLGRGPDQIDQIRRQREAARLSEEKIKLQEEAGRVREAAKLDHALRRLRSEARDLRDDADAEDDRVSRARGAAAAAYERALPARRRVASLQQELRDQCDVLCEDGPLAVADALFDGERVEGGVDEGISAKACARLLALVWLDAPELTDPEELPEAPCDAGGDLVALYGPPPPPPSSAARAGELAFDLGDNVYDRDAFRAVFVKAAAAGPLPWPDQAFQRMPLPRSPSPSPPSSPVDDVSPPASPPASPAASPPRSPATPASSRRAKTPKSSRPPSSRQSRERTPQGSPEAAAPPSPEEDAPPSPEAQAPPSPEAEPEFAVGQRIEANFEGEGEWFAGVVDKVEDGRYDITYDDGDEEFGVEAARVRAATGGADVLAPLPAPQDELRRSDEYEESFEAEN
jgi:hypothetical protein